MQHITGRRDRLINAYISCYKKIRHRAYIIQKQESASKYSMYYSIIAYTYL